MAPHERIELGLVQVPEGRLVFPFLSVLENLELGAYSARARRERSTSLNRVWDLFPVLKDRKKQLAGSLSGGEQQMLALGRGLMALPELLMLDEPSLGLAPILQEQLMATIEQLHEDGVTVLVVEQNVIHALRIADRGYVLEKGRIVMEGEATKLLDDDRLREAYMGL
jgi:branched-chain amino acid transport system ATP-binding protein